MALLSSVIGYGTLSARPVAGSAGRLYYATDTALVYRDNGTTWDTLSVGSRAQQLDYALATDTTVALTNSTWTDFIGNQSFSVAVATSLIEISVSGFVTVGSAGGNVGVRVVVDSAGTPINKMVSGAAVIAGNYSNVLAGAGIVSVSGLAVGAHTVKLQIYQANSMTAYCRPVTSQPNIESLQMRIFENQ